LQQHILADPQTSGGLLVAVHPAFEADFIAEAKGLGMELTSFGELVELQEVMIQVI
jgi:selenide,water dikinase